MKISTKYTLKKIGNEFYAIPLTQKKGGNAMVKLNDSGAFIFEKLLLGIEEDNLVAAVIKEYAVDEARAKEDIASFIQTMKEAHLID